MTGATDSAIAVLLGGALGTGAWTLLMLMPRWSAPSLVRRIAPYVRDVTDAAGTTAWIATADPGGLITVGARRLWQALRDRMTALLGGAEAVNARLARAGKPVDLAAFRGRQLAMGLAGFALGGAAVIALVLSGAASGPSLSLPLVGAGAGAVGCDIALTVRAQARGSRIAEELPTVLDFLSLCLAAGEGIFDSIARVALLGRGELTAELRRVVVDVRTGANLGDALTELARRLRVPVLDRSVEHIVAAIDRGAPLAQALQSLAADAREEDKRSLIERAGRKEILMLLPLVFVLLPLSVVYAIYPGLVILRLGLG